MKNLVLTLIVLCIHIGPSFAQLPNPSLTVVNINNVTSWVGSFGQHPPRVNLSWNGTFPKGTAGFIYSEGTFWGGLVNEGQGPSLRVNGHYYTFFGLTSGRILTDVSGNVLGREPADPATVRPYRVRPDWKTADLRDDAASFFLIDLDDVTSSHIDEIKTQYETDWILWPWQKGAPYDDKNTDGIYDPDVDIPGIPGASQTVWVVYNDIDSVKTFATMDCPPIGMEVQETYWAYATTTPLGNVVFKRARLIYKGTTSTPASATIDSMYIVQWADPDNGLWSDDFAGCDTLLGLGYAYNSTSTDPVYFKEFGLPPPAGGYDFLQGAIVPGSAIDSALFDFQWRKGFRNLPMTVFTFFSAGSPRSDPAAPFGSRAHQWYNLMAGFEPQPRYPAQIPLYNHFGQITKFEVSGDPVTQTGDIDGRRTAANQNRFPAGDRRIVLSTGPFTMTRGDTQEVVVALVAGLGKDYLSSISVMKYNDAFAQFAYDNLFQIPAPPPAPKVNIAELDRQIVLEWGGDPALTRLIEDTVRSGFAFEGYNIYQLPASTSRLQDWIRIATFDVANLTSIIIDKVLDENTAFVVEKPVQFGTNSGVQRYITITEDRIRTQPLVNGQTYYFAVTAYSFNPDLSSEAPFRTLESAPIVLTATPQSPKPGESLNAGTGTIVDATLTGTGDGSAFARVIDPSRITGHDYTISFGVVSSQKQWMITDATTNEVRASGFATYADIPSNPIVDGLQFVVLDPGAAGGIKSVVVANSDGTTTNIARVPSADGNWSIDAQGASSVTGLYTRMNWQNASGPYDYEIRFTPDDATASEYYVGGGGLLNSSPKAAGRIPLQVWNTTLNTRLLIKVLNDDGANSTYDTTGNFLITTLGSGVGWERIYASDVIPYNEPLPSPSPVEAGSNSVLGRIIVVDWNGTGFFPPPGTVVKMLTNKPILTTDSFTISTASIQPTTGDAARAVNDVQQINVFPNPYMGFNTREQSRLDKYVTFNHLPTKATIRIFNLAGVLLRVIEKDDPSQFARWNLRNRENLPVASGIYIVHIELPDLGTEKILKLAVVQEEQILNVY